MLNIFKKNSKGFTLVELLIVIVIIGLLSVSLMPKLIGMQARARDTARKASISQLSAAIMNYNTDNGTYPGENIGGQSTDNISGDVAQYLKDMPKDPQDKRKFSGVKNDNKQTPGYFMYTPVAKNGIPNAGFVLMAGMEAHGGDVNWVYDASLTPAGGIEAGEITTGADFLDLVKITCTRVKKGNVTQLNTGAQDTKCQAKEKVDNLRYMLLN